MNAKKQASKPSSIPLEKPRDLLPLEQILLREATRKVRIRSDGIDQEVSTDEVVVRKVIQTAAAGSPHAQGHFLRLLSSAQETNHAIIAGQVAEGYRNLERARDLLQNWITLGKDPKLCIPHPDDIIVTEGVGWQIRGPISESELAIILKRCRERDLLLAQAKLDERLASKVEHRLGQTDAKLRPDATARVMADLIDMSIPERFRLTPLETMMFEHKHDRMTKRELLKFVYSGWRKIGKRVKRGARLPSFAYFEHLHRATMQTLSTMEARDNSARPMSITEIADELTEKLNSGPAPFPERR